MTKKEKNTHIAEQVQRMITDAKMSIIYDLIDGEVISFDRGRELMGFETIEEMWDEYNRVETIKEGLK